MSYMKTATEFLYPASEPAFVAWEADQVAAGATQLVKLAFKTLDGFGDGVLRQAVLDDDFAGAQQRIWSLADAHRPYLETTRHITNSGCRILRFHALGQSQGVDVEPPHRASAYWRYVSMYFTHLNGPLAGEEVFAIPATVDAATGLSRQDQEVHVAFDDDRRCLGAATVRYNAAKSAVAARTLYEAPHAVARSASRVAKTLLGGAYEVYRLPYVRPSSALQQRIGLSALEVPHYVDPQGFDDLLPNLLH